MTATPATPDAQDDQPSGRSDFVALASGVELHVLHWDPADVGSATTGTADVNPHTWVLTHGLASNARMWDGVALRLAAAGHRVVTVDQRGHGQSSKPDGPYDVATCADDLALLIEELGLERPAVAGQSWGGNVVLELGYRHPDKVEQVTCVDGGFIELRERFPDWHDCEVAMAPPPLAGIPLAKIQEWLDTFAADWPEEGRRGTLANFEVRDDGTIAPWLILDRHLAVLRGLWEHSPSTRYADMAVPTLFIVADSGDHDWTDAKERAVEHALATLPTGRAEWFRHAHHDVHAQHPGPVAALLRAAATDPEFWSAR